jgi:hypothetical protein
MTPNRLTLFGRVAEMTHETHETAALRPREAATAWVSWVSWGCSKPTLETVKQADTLYRAVGNDPRNPRNPRSTAWQRKKPAGSISVIALRPAFAPGGAKP